jgi:ParB family transcriptional regulator, chromosome partitioning protein
MTLQTASVSIPMNGLYYGHEATPPINARRSGREDEVKELASSIEAHGLIHPLLVKLIEGSYYVADGNRRLAAFRHLAEQGRVSPDEQIKCELDESDSDAEELSLAANVMRTPLHQADMFVAFKELAERGFSEPQIASRFGVEPKRVHRFLAIGRIAPEILDAWRNDELGRDPVSIIRAFTMGPTPEEQVRVFHDLRKADSLNAHQVAAAFGAGNQQTQKALKICGIEAYRAAGGALTEDLFGDRHAVSDPQLAIDLAAKTLDDRRDALVAEGWAWAEFADDMPYSWKYSYEKVKAGKKGNFTAEQMAKAGCVVEVEYHGEVTVHHGLIRPAKSKTSDTSEPKEKKPATISDALMLRLSSAVTEAMREAIVLEPRIGLIALLAGFLADDYSVKPVRVSHQGMQRNGGAKGETNYTAAFELLSGMTDQRLFEVAADIAASALDLRSSNSLSLPFKEHNGALAGELDAANTYVALRGRFDPEDYFSSVSKEFLVKAITEAINEDEARKAGGLKKPELVAYALANVPPTGWLPVELRTIHYNGPGAA